LSSSISTFWRCSARLRSLMSISMLTPPTTFPAGVAQRRRVGLEGTRVPSGRSATASAPRIGRPCLTACAIGHSSCGSGVPSADKGAR